MTLAAHTLQTPDQVRAADALRAAAVLGVVIGHASVAYALVGRKLLAWPADLPATTWLAEGLISLVRPLPVPMFFFAAGFSARCCLRRGGAGALARTRLRGLGLPLLASALILLPLVYAVWVWGLLGQDPQVDHWILHSHVRKLIRHEIIGPAHLWFLRDLLIVSLVYAAGARLFSRWGGGLPRAGSARSRATIARAALAVLVPAAMIWLRPKIVIGFANTFWPHLTELVYHGTFFIAGTRWYGAQRGAGARTASPTAPWLAAWGCLYVVQLLVMYLGFAGLSQPAVRGGLALCTTAYAWTAIRTAIVLAGSVGPRGGRLLARLARASYWVYLAHLPLLGCLVILMRPLPLSGAIKIPLVCLGTLTLTGLAWRLLVHRNWLPAITGQARRMRRPGARVRTGAPAS